MKWTGIFVTVMAGFVLFGCTQTPPPVSQPPCICPEPEVIYRTPPAIKRKIHLVHQHNKQDLAKARERLKALDDKLKPPEGEKETSEKP